MKRLLIFLLIALPLSAREHDFTLYSPHIPEPKEITVVAPGIFPQVNTFCAANLACSVTGAWSFSNLTSLTVSGTAMLTGPFNPKQIGAELYASAFAGTTCADKITAAAAALPANGGVIDVNQACGTGTATSPWTALTIPANVHVRFVEQGTYWTNKITLSNLSELTSVIPCSPGLLNLTCPVTVEEGNGLNLTSHIQVPINANQTSIQYINQDGNKANNPTEGVGLLVQGQSFYGFYFITQHNASHGTFYSSTGIANQACCFINIGHFTANNNGDGMYVLNTADGRMEAPSYENNGITATVNTTATTVTATSGSWSTDSSLVGTHFHLGNGTTTWYSCVVSAIPSTTTITLGQCISLTPTPGTVTVIGTNSGWTIYWGNGDEYSNSPTIREVNHDHGGNLMNGHEVYATTGSVLTSNGHIMGSGQFGNNFNCDIEYISDATANGSANLTGGVFNGLQIQPTNANRTPTNVWANICMVDGGAHTFDGVTFAGGTAPHQLAYGILIGETSANRYTPSSIRGIQNLANTSYGTKFLDDVSAQGSFVRTGNAFFTNGNGSTSALQLYDVTNNNTIYVRNNNGAFQFLNTGFGVPTNLTGVNLSGAVFSSSFTPAVAGGTDLGSVALPAGNLWLGNAATNNNKLTSTTTAARVTTFPDASLTVAGINIAQTFTAAQTLGAGGSLNATSLLISPTAPTIAGAGCGGTVAAIQNANGTASFEIFTGTAPTSAGCTVMFPAAAHHWICPTITHTSAVSTTNFIILQTGALSSTSVTFQLFSDVAAATAPAASDTWAVSGCHAN